jgi:hypothetical protein
MHVSADFVQHFMLYSTLPLHGPFSWNVLSFHVLKPNS